jgi:hypothetical protein
MKYVYDLAQEPDLTVDRSGFVMAMIIYVIFNWMARNPELFDKICKAVFNADKYQDIKNVQEENNMKAAELLYDTKDEIEFDRIYAPRVNETELTKLFVHMDIDKEVKKSGKKYIDIAKELRTNGESIIPSINLNSNIKNVLRVYINMYNSGKLQRFAYECSTYRLEM